MKVLLLAPGNSIHTIKWANSLSEKGIEIYLFSLYHIKKEDFNPKVKLESFEVSADLNAERAGSFKKLYYLKALKKIKNIIRTFKPDIVHSHYASSYGLLGTLANFHPYYVSVWGADVFSFPLKSFLHKMILQFIFKRADKILSTSHFMADSIIEYTDKKIFVTPFGIDAQLFRPGKKANLFDNDSIVIGTIKGLEPQYGVEYLIEAFSILKMKRKENLKLLIVGTGSLENKIKDKIREMNLQDSVVLTGFIPHSQIVNYHNELDIYAALSTTDDESFGVAIIEASSCEKPVVVSKVGGLTEVVKDGYSGLFAEKMNSADAADKIEQFIENPEMRFAFGKNGRNLVLDNYQWDKCLEIMLNIYNKAE